VIPGKYDITMTRGCTFPAIVLTFSGQSGPVDLTGWVPYAEVRLVSHGRVILDLEPVITDAVNGEVTLAAFTDEETAALKQGDYLWDFIMDDGTGAIMGRFLAGDFNIVNKVTKS
jgi:hypothetical protein